MHPSRTDQAAFSLLELLVALAIVAILSVISYPQYHHHLTRAHCRNAEQTLIALAGRLEEYNSSHDSYQGATLAALQQPSETEDHSYRLQLIIKQGQHYLIRAIPLGTKHRGILSLDDRGIKKPWHRCN